LNIDLISVQFLFRTTLKTNKMAITAKDVNKLRQMTGAGMMDCKKALTEAEGDFDKAIEVLRKKGQKVSASRADRETSEGVVFVRTNDDNTRGMMLSFTCETDFVAKNEAFLDLGNTIVNEAFAQNLTTVDDILKLNIAELSVSDKITELTGKIGEKLEIKEVIRMTGEVVVPYTHSNNKLGVLVSLKNVNGADAFEAGKDVAMQIAAMNPIAVDKEGVDQSVIEKEIEIGKDQARQEGKPDNIIEKIAMGKLNKFFAENTLLSQKFVKDNAVSIAQYLDSVSKGLTVADFSRVAIG